MLIHCKERLNHNIFTIFPITTYCTKPWHTLTTERLMSDQLCHHAYFI